MKRPTKPRARANRALSTRMANGNISAELAPGDLADIEHRTEAAARAMLMALRIDVDADHNTRGTPARVAKMFVRELFAGRFEPPPRLTLFPNVKGLDELYVHGPLTVRSTCAHHLCPIEGRWWVGVIPGKQLMGLSKFARLGEWIMARPQIQEEATVQLADAIEAAIKPRALAVIVTARHGCMSLRGVREPAALMTTSVMRGLFRKNDAARAEVLALLAAKGLRPES